MSIIEDNKRQLNRFKNNPPHSSYIAGFIDGDGCIFIRKILLIKYFNIFYFDQILNGVIFIN